MGEVIFKLDCELVYEPGEGIEVHIRHGGSLSREVIQHLSLAGREVSLALERLANPVPERAQKKVRKKIEVEEA